MPYCQSQGILNIPLFLAPYTVPWSSSRGMALNANANDYAINDTAYVAFDGSNPTDGIYGASITRLQPNAYQQVNVGDYNGTTGVAIGQGGRMVCQGQWGYYGLGTSHAAGTGPNAVSMGSSSIPLFKSANYANMPGFEPWTSAAITNFAPNGMNQVMQQAYISLVELPGVVVPGVAFPLTIGSGLLQTLAFWAPGLNDGAVQNTGGPIGNTGPLSSFHFSGGFIVPDRVNGANTWWCTGNAQTVPLLINLQLFCSLLSQAMWAVIGLNADPLVFDNPTINTWVNAGQQEFQATANGVLMSSTITGRGDYYISRDGTKYWQINYVNYSGIAIRDNAIELVYPSRTIDAQGIFWYTGGNTANGTTLQPLYSFATNIPFNPIFLPQIPPMTMPCWSDCLDRIGGSPGQLFNTI
jgi:hypothetical protein